MNESTKFKSEKYSETQVVCVFRFFSVFCVLKIVCVRNGYLKFFSNCMIFKISKRAVTYPKYQKIIKILECSVSKLTNLAIITTYSI